MGQWGSSGHIGALHLVKFGQTFGDNSGDTGERLLEGMQGGTDGAV
jgi:hypothetical protein